MGRICAQMFQFWRFTNQMMRYKVGQLWRIVR
jgi:hypothetical protein